MIFTYWIYSFCNNLEPRKVRRMSDVCGNRLFPYAGGCTKCDENKSARVASRG